MRGNRTTTADADEEAGAAGQCAAGGDRGGDRARKTRDLARLIGMGFPEEVALAALASSNGTGQAAASLSAAADAEEDDAEGKEGEEADDVGEDEEDEEDEDAEIAGITWTPLAEPDAAGSSSECSSVSTSSDDTPSELPEPIAMQPTMGEATDGGRREYGRPDTARQPPAAPPLHSELAAEGTLAEGDGIRRTPPLLREAAAELVRPASADVLL